MSHVPRSPDLPIERDTLDRAASTVAETVRTVRQGLRAAGFWAAVVLPVTYLPLLAGGLTGPEALVFVALLALNAGALVVGHDHTPADGR